MYIKLFLSEKHLLAYVLDKWYIKPLHIFESFQNIKISYKNDKLIPLCKDLQYLLQIQY